MSSKNTPATKSGFWGQILLLSVAQSFLMFAYGAVLPLMLKSRNSNRMPKPSINETPIDER